MEISLRDPLRVVFMGTPRLAAVALSDLYDAGYEIPLVLTRPDSPAGRGKKIACSSVKAFAMSKGLTVIQPGSLKNDRVLQLIIEAGPDVIVTAAYGKILPKAVLEAAPLGCLNIHPSLLPAYRGASPIQWALLSGETQTGVTIMKSDEGIDTGPILAQETLSVSDDMDYGSLYEALSALGSRLLLETLPLWARGEICAREQSALGVSYAGKMTREREIIAWDRPAKDIANHIRAFSPAPGASASIDGKEIKILAASALTGSGLPELLTNSAATTAVPELLTNAAATTAAPELLATDAAPGLIAGIIRRQGPVIRTGDGFLLITRVKPAGKNPMDAWSWLNGSRLKAGQSFTAISGVTAITGAP